MIAVCKKCGKEYQIENGDNPKKYQCDCGGNLKTIKIQGESYKRKEPILSLILSFFIPGLGQIYNGQTERGIILLIAAFVSAFLILFLIGIALYLAVWVFSMYDAFISAKKINNGEPVNKKLF